MTELYYYGIFNKAGKMILKPTTDEEVMNMISERNFRDALLAAGATQVSHDALLAFDAWMHKFMTQEAHKAVTRMQADKRVRIERRDIGE